jgi:hypothetical protein
MRKFFVSFALFLVVCGGAFAGGSKEATGYLTLDEAIQAAAQEILDANEKGACGSYRIYRKHERTFGLALRHSLKHMTTAQALRIDPNDANAKHLLEEAQKMKK